MDIHFWLMIGIFLISGYALCIFNRGKKGGFGKFNTSVFLLLLVLIISGLLCAACKLKSELFANLMFAIIGFAGGLFTGKDANSSKEIDKPGAQESESGGKS